MKGESPFMDVKPIKVDKVEDSIFASYKERLAKKLMKYNMHADAIANNASFKQSIENYVIENVINNINKNAIIGISKKLANMDVKLPNGEHVTFPIIHTYKYHNLVSTTIFYLDEQGNFKAEDIPLMETPLIIT